MATTSTVKQRAERDIDALTRFIAELPGISHDWDGLDESEQISLSLDWAHLMADYLTELDEYFQKRLLTDEQARCYGNILAELKEMQPVIVSLRFYPPTVALDAAAGT